MHFGFDQDTFYERFPDRPVVQLSIWGSSAEGPLEDLAADPAFAGTVVAGFNGTPHNDPKFAPWVPEYLTRAERGFGVADRVAFFLRSLRDLALVSPDERFGWRALLVRLALGQELPRRDGQYIRLRLDRDAKIDLEAEGRYNVLGLADDGKAAPSGQAWSSEAWWERADRIAAIARRLNRKGCRVVFVRPPESGAKLRWEDELHPRATHWDQFAKLVESDGRNVVLHFRDVPGMSNLACPDGLHLDQRDAPAFTAALLDELERRGVL